MKREKCLISPPRWLKPRARSCWKTGAAALTNAMDLVSDDDLIMERFLAEAIRNKYPGHDILAEESEEWSAAPGESCGYRWVIDPIDGTVNYYRFRKDYAISLALYREAQPVWGLVYDIAAGVMYSAGRG